MTAVLNASVGYETLDIMVDYDDVIIPWFDTVDAKCKELGLDRRQAGPCRQWKMWVHYGCTEEEWQNAVVAATAEGLYSKTEPFVGAVQAINRLRWYGHRVHIYTARGFMQNADNIRRWTVEHAADYGIGYDSLEFTRDKGATMLERGIRFDYAIDDAVHNLDKLAQVQVKGHLHTATHNEEISHPRRVNSLWDFANQILAETTPLASSKGIPA